MDTKPFWQSKTFYGLFAVAAGVFGLGDLIPPDFGEKVAASVTNILEIGGMLLAAYGRIKAKTNVGV